MTPVSFFFALQIYMLPMYLHALNLAMMEWQLRQPTSARQTRMMKVDNNHWVML